MVRMNPRVLRMGIAGLGMASRQILPYFRKIPF